MRLVRSGVVFAGAAAVLALGTGPSAAHSELIGSLPTDGETVATAPDVVELAFDQPVRREYSRLAVLDEGGRHHEQGEAAVVGGRFRQPVDSLSPGRYRVSYRIVSVDGHAVSGTVTFTVAETSNDDATTSPPPELGAARSHDEVRTTTAAGDASGVSPLLLIAGGVAAVGVLGAAVLFAMGGRKPGRGAPDGEAETAP